MKGAQKATFDKAKTVITAQAANIEYVIGDEPQNIKNALVNATIYKGNSIQQLKADTELLESKIAEQIEAEKVKALEVIELLKTKLESFDDFKTLELDKQQQLIAEFSMATKKVDQQSLVAMLRDEARRFEDLTYSQLVQKLMAWSQPAPSPITPVSGSKINTQPEDDLIGGKPTPTPAVEEPVKPEIQSVSAKQIRVDYAKPWLSTESDVEGYVEEYKKALLLAIKEGKHVQL